MASTERTKGYRPNGALSDVSVDREVAEQSFTGEYVGMALIFEINPGAQLVMRRGRQWDLPGYHGWRNRTTEAKTPRNAWNARKLEALE